MENIFIVLAIIASVIYQFYKNYKEEMEKASKRQQQARRVQPPVDTDVAPVPATQPRPPVQLPSRPAIPVPEIRRPTVRKPVSPTPTLRADSSIPKEIKKAPKLQSQHERTKDITLIVDDQKQVDQGINQLDVQFDLKTAIIQSAILERPYK